MQSDRDDMVRLKLEVEAVQSEVLSDFNAGEGISCRHCSKLVAVALW
jgi:hypothetical protein